MYLQIQGIKEGNELLQEEKRIWSSYFTFKWGEGTEVALFVKALAAKPDYLRWTPGSHMVVGEN